MSNEKMNEILSKLSNDGWKLNNYKANLFLSSHNVDTKYDDVKKIFLMNDLKLFSEAWLDLSNKTEIECSGIVQINKVKNVAAPDVDQESKNNTPLYKYIVSDGTTSIPLLDLRSGNAFRHSISLGGKIYIKGKVTQKSGMIVLNGKDNSMIKYLGGQILDLIKTESFNQTSKNRRVTSREDGPPRFVPFGEKLTVNVQEMKRFKALQDGSMKGPQNASTAGTKDSEFGNLRDAEIKKARNQLGNDSNTIHTNTRSDNVQTASDLLSKFHSGGTSTFVKNTIVKQDMIDSYLAELMKHGFSIGASKRALENTGYNVSAALNKLNSGPNKNRSMLSPDQGSSQSDTTKSQRNKGKGKGGNNTDDLEDDPWFDPVRYAEQVGLQSKPQTTIDLLGILSSQTNHPAQSTQQKRDQVKPGDKCLAQGMDGSYQEAVIVSILEERCVRVRYLTGRYEGEIMELTNDLLRRENGERIESHMIPSCVRNDLRDRYPQDNFDSNRDRGNYFRGRGGNPRGRSGRRGGRGRRPSYY